MTNKEKALIASLIPPWMIVDAVRYCIGRMSCQVSTTTDWLCENWPYIEVNARGIVRRDVEEAFERSNGEEHMALGMDMDRRNWERVRALWRPTNSA